VDDVTVHKFPTCVGEFIDLIMRLKVGSFQWKKRRKKTGLGNKPREYFLFHFFSVL
jgi:hypothetical protein